MAVERTLYDAEFRLDLTLDPPAETWEPVREGDGAPSTQVYRSGGYVLRLEEQRGPAFTVVTFELTRDDGKDFTVGRCALRVAGSIGDVYRMWIPYLLHTWVAAANLFREIPGGFLRDVPLSVADRRMPLILGLNRKGEVTLGAGFVDQRLETEMRVRAATQISTCDLEKGKMTLELARPAEGYSLGPVSEHRDAFFACRGPFWFDAVHEYGRVHAEVMDRPVQPSPDAAWEPLWAPWIHEPGKYGKLHQNDVGEDLLLEAARIALDLGIRTVTNMGSWCFKTKPEWAVKPALNHWGLPTWGWPEQLGDYLPDTAKFPDFRGTVRKLHDMGARIMLWMSPFVVGAESNMREKMQDYLIDLDVPDFFSSHLCPRNPVVQDHVEALVARVMRDYEADGYTMDMLTTMTTGVCTADHEHNFSSYGMAVDHCYARIKAAIQEVNPDALIEFRQIYANINSLSHATTFRAHDSGDTGNYELDRSLCVQLRSYAPPGFAVHLDPIWWRLDEEDTTVAKMLSTMVVSGVPQFGVDLVNIPDRHRKLIKRWLEFYQQHKEDFRHGRLRPVQNDVEFSTIMVSAPGKAFISYGNYPALRVRVAEGVREAYLFNCTNEDRLYTILEGLTGTYRAVLHDHTLAPIGETEVSAGDGSVLVDARIPQGAYVLLKPL
jgi:hypothetical protein